MANSGLCVLLKRFVGVFETLYESKESIIKTCRLLMDIACNGLFYGT
jgi:hypothetical protein